MNAVLGEADKTMTRVGWVLALPVLALACVVLFVSAPTNGDFWWSDAPRHALNGAFVKDLVAAMPRDPRGFAMDYYLKYPALTILFYPPLLYVVSAPFYAVLGVAHTTAQFVVILFYFAFAAGSYALARLWLPAGLALALAVTLCFVPEIALWGRQVMLEIPAFALLIWGIYFALRYRESARPPFLYGAGACLVLALYAKLSTVFVLPVILILLVQMKGVALLRDKHAWIVAALCAIGLVPLIGLTLMFGQGNVQSVVGIDDAVTSRTTLSGWLWYLARLPEQLGWLLLALGLAGAGAVVAKHRALPHLGFLALWFAVGYLFFSAIDLKEARHSVFILWPLVLLAFVLLHRALPARAGLIAGIGLALATATSTLAFFPVPRVGGYAEAVDIIAKRAPANATVVFSGKRDGAFVFDMRAREDRRDIDVIRADKLLLRVAIRRELGVEEKSATPEEIAKMMDDYGVSYIVAQSDFWTDLKTMENLQTALRSDRFEEVARIATNANVPVEDRELRIYRNKTPISAERKKLRIDLPIINRTIE
jgi:4-amino-4-deoxy-L-arabinose transferase-like glycosyltransferase